MDILQEIAFQNVAIFTQIDSAIVFAAKCGLPVIKPSSQYDESVMTSPRTSARHYRYKGTIFSHTNYSLKKDGPSMTLYGSLPQYHLEEE